MKRIFHTIPAAFVIMAFLLGSIVALLPEPAHSLPALRVGWWLVRDQRAAGARTVRLPHVRGWGRVRRGLVHALHANVHTAHDPHKATYTWLPSGLIVTKRGVPKSVIPPSPCLMSWMYSRSPVTASREKTTSALSM